MYEKLNWCNIMQNIYSVLYIYVQLTFKRFVYEKCNKNYLKLIKNWSVYGYIRNLLRIGYVCVLHVNVNVMCMYNKQNSYKKRICILNIYLHKIYKICRWFKLNFIIKLFFILTFFFETRNIFHAIGNSSWFSIFWNL